MENNEVMIAENVEEVVNTCSTCGNKGLKGAGIAAAVVGLVGLAGAGIYALVKKHKERKTEQADPLIDVSENEWTTGEDEA